MNKINKIINNVELFKKFAKNIISMIIYNKQKILIILNMKILTKFNLNNYNYLLLILKNYLSMDSMIKIIF